MLKHFDRGHGGVGRHGGGRSGRGGGWPGRGGHGERGFEHGRLKLVLLHLIADKPSHGYELIKAIEERTQGAYTPSPGAVYPTLTLLEELGYITLDTSDGQRKLCQITDEGRRFLAENQHIVAELEARLSRPAGGARGDGAIAAPIVRAMENLHTALRLRLAGATLGKEQVHAIAATLDAAATGIEQI